MIYLKLFYTFCKIGAFSFGGGLAMLPLIFQSIQKFGIMTTHEFSNLVALSQVTPGPIAINAAAFVGFNYAGVLGALSATIGVAAPSFIIVIIVMKFVDRFYESKVIQGIFYGIRPVTVGLIMSAVIFVAESVLVNGKIFTKALFTSGIDYFNIVPIVLFIVTILLVKIFKMKPIPIMIIMAVAGGIFCS